MLKKVFAYLCASLLFYVPVYGQQISFLKAWSEVIKHSNALKAKEENLRSAHAKLKAARDLNWPELTLSASYTRLDAPISTSFSDMHSEGALRLVMGSVLEGGFTNIYKKTYEQALQKYGDPAKAKKISDAKIASLKSEFKNSSIEISKQDIFTGSLRAMWPIFTGGRIEAASVVANGQIKEALSMLEMEKQARFEELARLYFAVVLSKEVANTKKEVQDALQKHLEHAKKLQAQGQIAHIQTLQARASFDKARVDALKAYKQHNIAKIALENAIHTKTSIETKTKLFVNENLASMEEFLNKTLAHHPGLKLLDAKKVQTKGLIKASKGSYYPQVFLFGNYNLYHDDTLLFKNSPRWLAGVGINLPLISSQGRSGKLEEAYRKDMQVSYLKEDARRNLTVLVKKTYKEAKLALEEYKGLKSSLLLAQENVKLRSKSFSQGLATSLDVIDAELFLQGVKTQRLVASYEYVLSLSKLLALSSQMNEFLNYEVNK